MNGSLNALSSVLSYHRSSVLWTKQVHYFSRAFFGVFLFHSLSPCISYPESAKHTLTRKIAGEYDPEKVWKKVLNTVLDKNMPGSW